MTTPLTRHTGHLVEGMGWTKEPTVPGLYFRMVPDFAPYVAELVFRDGFIQERSCGSIYPLVKLDGEKWSGPIPLPSEAPAQGWYKAEEVEGREVEVVKFLQSVPCSCAHSNPNSSQEWDRRHESWCPEPKAKALLDRLKGGV